MYIIQYEPTLSTVQIIQYENHDLNGVLDFYQAEAGDDAQEETHEDLDSQIIDDHITALSRYRISTRMNRRKK